MLTIQKLEMWLEVGNVCSWAGAFTCWWEALTCNPSCWGVPAVCEEPFCPLLAVLPVAGMWQQQSWMWQQTLPSLTFLPWYLPSVTVPSQHCHKEIKCCPWMTQMTIPAHPSPPRRLCGLPSLWHLKPQTWLACVVTFRNRQGSAVLLKVTGNLWLWAMANLQTLKALHIPGLELA